MRFISMVIIALTLPTTSSVAGRAEDRTMTLEQQPELPAFDTLWNFGDPAGTESKFRALLPTAVASGNVEYRAELLTQIARTLGLQQKFDEAHAVLDEADSLITPEMTSARTRSLLERGRALNSSGSPEEAVSLFDRALTLAQDSGLENYAVDAAHMLGIVTNGEDALAWNMKAMEMAEAAVDPMARRWRGSLANNLGWTWFERKDYEKALSLFERHLEIRTEQADTSQVFIARWSIARTYRFLGRTSEALALLEELLEITRQPGADPDGYVHEEMGECLFQLGRAEEARLHFSRAWELLRTDPWLSRDEPDRLERLKRLGNVEAEHSLDEEKR